MNTINRAFLDAVLADIVYVDGLTAGMGQVGNDTQINNFRNLIARRITDPLAREVAARFEVLAVRSDPESDYQGAVFRDKTTGEVYVAHRGTAGTTDIFDADVDLALGSSVARDQTAAMVNWWNEISKPAGTQVTEVAVGELGQGQNVFVPNGTATATGQVAGALAAAGGTVRVVGHSLGGHLTTVFSSVFSSQVSHSSTFNGAGMFSVGSGAIAGALAAWVLNETGTPLTQLAQVLGTSVVLPGESKQDNFYAMNGMSLTTNDLTFTQLGTRIGIYNEEDVTTPISIGNHFLYKQTDTLALYRAIETLDPSVSIAKLNSLAQAASPDDKYIVNERTLEYLLDGLRRVMLDPSVASTPPGDDGGDWEAGAMPASRIAYHANLKSLTDSSAFQSIAGKVRVDLSTKDLAAKARNDFSALASLLTLSPVVISATSAPNQAVLDGVLQATWGSVYGDWQTDKSMSLADRQSGKETFTDRWIADRATLLESVVALNNKNGSGTAYSNALPSDRSYELRWVDPAGAQQTLIAENSARQGGVLRPVPSQLIQYGGDAAETIAGSDNQLEDHLYGGAGADTLNAQGGNDYLEGNSGDDRLNGGAGNDTLVGGTGLDTFVVGANSGRDIIIDGQSIDVLQLAGRVLSGAGTLQSDTADFTVWLDESVAGQPVSYRIDKSTRTLNITGHGSTVVVNNFDAGDLGISVPTSSPVTPPEPSRIFDLAIQTHLNAYTDSFSVPGGDTTPVHLTNASTGYESGDALWVNSPLPAQTGVAHIHQALVSGTNAGDVIEGGPGDPLHRVVIEGRGGDDYLYADTQMSLDAAIARGETDPASGTGWLWLDGGSGDNHIVADAGNDIMTANTGDDTFVAGAGNDVIVADMPGVPLNIGRHPVTLSLYTPWASGTGDPSAFNGPDLSLGWTVATTSTVHNSPGIITSHPFGLVFDPMWALDLTDLYTMQRSDVPLDADEDPSATRTYAELHGPGWNGMSLSVGGNDVIHAGAGNDAVNAGAGDDIVLAGTGADLVAGYDGDDFIDGGDGDDWLSGDFRAFNGTDPFSESVDVYGAQVVVHYTLDPARHGQDYLDGGAGDDHVYGGGAADQLFGGAGDDVLVGDDDFRTLGIHAGDDFIDGEAGDDEIYGGGGADELLGGAGDDLLIGDRTDDGVAYSGNDLLDGGDGNDELWGAGKDDHLNGGAGNDRLFGDATESTGENTTTFGSDVLEGGEGDDLLHGEGGNDALLGGAGADALHGGLGDDTLLGGEGSDLLFGGSGADFIAGDEGNDALSGGAGDDTLDGGTGNDTLDGGSGNNVYLFGIGDGRDTISVTESTAGASNVLRFKGLVASQVVATRAGSNLELTIQGTSDKVLVPSFFANDTPGHTANPIQRIEFADGASWSLEQLVDQTTTGGAASDQIRGTTGNNNLSGAGGADLLLGLDGNDYIDGGSGEDWLEGGTGNDVLQGGEGTDTVRGGDGDDIYLYSSGDGVDSITDFQGNNKIHFGGTIVPENLTARVINGGAALSLSMGVGDEIKVSPPGTHPGYSPFIRLIDLPGELRFANGESWDRQRLYQEALRGTSGDDSIQGFADNDTLNGGDGNDFLWGHLGDDAVNGDAGDDWIAGWWGDDVLSGGAGNDTLSDDHGNDILVGGTGDDTFIETGIGVSNDIYRYRLGDGHDTIVDHTDIGNDRIELGAGISAATTQLFRTSRDDLKLSFEDGGEIVWSTSTPNSDGVSFEVAFSDGTLWSQDQVRQLAVAGSTDGDVRHGFNESDDVIDGLAGNDILHGHAGNDRLSGGTGDDILYGGLGDDTIDGGAGNDWVHGDWGNNTYLFGAGDGQDVIGSYYDYLPARANTLRFKAGISPSDVSILRSVGNANAIEVVIAGTTDKVIVNNFLFGGAPNNDFNPLQRIEFADGTAWNTATIVALISTNQPPVVAASIADQSAAEDSAYAFTIPASTFTDADASNNALAYTATLADGSALPAWLSFDAATRSFSGTPSNADVGTIHISATATDAFGLSAVDTFALSIANTNDAPNAALPIADQVAIEREPFRLTIPANTFVDVDAGDALSYALTLADGSALPPWLTFNSSSRVLSGTPFNADVGTLGLRLAATDMAGASASLSFNLGVANVNDRPLVDVPLADQNAQAGVAFGYTVPADAFSDPDVGDMLSYSASLSGGGPLPAWLSFDAGTRTFSGTPPAGVAGILSLRVTATDSTGYNASDVFDLNVAGDNTLDGTTGNDTLTGTAGRDLISGQAGADHLSGLAGDDVLDGGSGNDTMLGGTGNDVYIVDQTADVVTEGASEGTDTVQASVTMTLGANVENLTLTGTSAINGTGNALANVLTGNSAANTLSGGAGNDTYHVGTGDTVTEAAGAGTDTVVSSVSWTLGSNLENLTLGGTSAINGTGNTLANVITGNSANNTLSGGTGGDTLIGGAGNDTYIVDNIADVVTELAAEGTDLVQSSVTYTLSSNVENLTLTGTSAISGTGNALDNVLTGNSANNTLTGGAGNDTLNGGSGKDTMRGGTGDDTYVVNVATDVVTENADEGNDTVQSSVTLTLGSNVENLALTGTSAINATGNTLSNVLTGNSANNTLTGNAGNDTLDGGAGNDTMRGGTGDDNYVVNVATDVVTENANEGIDTVRSSVTLTLGSNVENLTLTGTSAINGTGNTLNNVLSGNSAANTLTGGAGNDTYDGAGGNDTCSDTSTSSADIYRWGLGSGTDTVTDAGGSDYVDVLAGITLDQLRFAQNGNHLEMTAFGHADKLIISNWYALPANQIEEFRLSDGNAVIASQVNALIDAMATFSVPAAGSAPFTPRHQEQYPTLVTPSVI